MTGHEEPQAETDEAITPEEDTARCDFVIRGAAIAIRELAAAAAAEQEGQAA